MIKFNEGRIQATPTCPAGVGHDRLAHPDHHYDQERLFRLAWQYLHGGPEYASSSRDLLAHLLNARRFEHSVTPRDRVVAATVIQWLGTNVGSCFLRDVMQEYADGVSAVALVDSARWRLPGVARLARPLHVVTTEEARRSLLAESFAFGSVFEMRNTVGDAMKELGITEAEVAAW